MQTIWIFDSQCVWAYDAYHRVLSNGFTYANTKHTSCNSQRLLSAYFVYVRTWHRGPGMQTAAQLLFIHAWRCRWVALAAAEFTVLLFHNLVYGYAGLYYQITKFRPKWVQFRLRTGDRVCAQCRKQAQAFQHLLNVITLFRGTYARCDIQIIANMMRFVVLIVIVW